MPDALRVRALYPDTDDSPHSFESAHAHSKPFTPPEREAETMRRRSDRSQESLPQLVMDGMGKSLGEKRPLM
jgi:hypothetical protein